VVNYTNHNEAYTGNEAEGKFLTLEAEREINTYIGILEHEPRVGENISRLDSFDPDIGTIFVVPAYNEDPDTISGCVGSLYNAGQVAGQKVGVIVVINSSDKAPESITATNQACNNMLATEFADKNILIVRRYGVDGFPGERAGVGSARNIGGAYAGYYALSHGSDIIVQHTDADTEVNSDFVEKLTQYYSDPNVKATAGELIFRYPQGAEYERMAVQGDLGHMYQTLVGELCLSPSAVLGVEDEAFPGSNMSSRISVLATVGGIPELRGAEDVGFRDRLLARAIPIVRPKDLIARPLFRESDRTTTGHGLGVIQTMDVLRADADADVPVDPISLFVLREEIIKTARAENIHFNELSIDAQLSYLDRHERLREKLDILLKDVRYKGTVDDFFDDAKSSRPVISKVFLSTEVRLLWSKALERESEKAEEFHEQLLVEINRLSPAPVEPLQLEAYQSYLASGSLNSQLATQLKVIFSLTDEQIAKAEADLDRVKTHAMLNVLWKRYRPQKV